MNAKQQYAANNLVNQFVTHLNMDNNSKIHSAIYRALKTKNIDDTQRALEFILQTIVQGSIDENYVYHEQEV